VSNPEVTISLTAPVSNERDASRQIPFSLAAMGRPDRRKHLPRRAPETWPL